jgi:hypothetical protein
MRFIGVGTEKSWRTGGKLTAGACVGSISSWSSVGRSGACPLWQSGMDRANGLLREAEEQHGRCRLSMEQESSRAIYHHTLICLSTSKNRVTLHLRALFQFPLSLKGSFMYVCRCIIICTYLFGRNESTISGSWLRSRLTDQIDRQILFYHWWKFSVEKRQRKKPY